jgi:heme/copper-type cytochrome/quinol oxidase subunit 4
VQLICFLRMNYDTEQARMNVQSFALGLFILFIVVIGSLWIMVNLAYRM